MKAVATNETVVTLVLTEGEARILMGMVQNPTCDPTQEPIEEATFRKSLFDTLKDVTLSQAVRDGVKNQYGPFDV